MAGIPGELHERPWKDFAHNRNEALELARGKADHVLVLDADDFLDVAPGFVLARRPIARSRPGEGAPPRRSQLDY